MSSAEPLPDGRNAYELLSKPTLTLTLEERKLIVADLRLRRQRFLQGKLDKPSPSRSRTATLPVDASPEAKAARTENLLNDIGNLF